MIQLRSRGTKLVGTRCLLKPLCHQTLDLETSWPTHRPRNPILGDITATPLSESVWFCPRSCLERIALLFHAFLPPNPLFYFQFSYGCEWRSFLQLGYCGHRSGWR